MVSGLTNGTPYTFHVTATNAIGTGPASSSSNPVTPSTVPGAPTIGTAAAGNAQATVHWWPPSDNGGSPILSFRAEVVGDPTTFCTGAPPDTSCTITGLTNGTSYRFRVAASNTNGFGAYSAESNEVIPQE
jgi:hypothetical protein